MGLWFLAGAELIALILYFMSAMKVNAVCKEGKKVHKELILMHRACNSHGEVVFNAIPPAPKNKNNSNTAMQDVELDQLDQDLDQPPVSKPFYSLCDVHMVIN